MSNMVLFHKNFPSPTCLNFGISKAKKYSIGPVSMARLRRGIAFSRPLQCMADGARLSDEQSVARRSANYQTPIWSFDYVQSLRSQYTGEPYAVTVENLKEEVRATFKKLGDDHLAQLEHIDLLQRLGLSYHFENEVKTKLKGIYTKYSASNNNNVSNRNNLYATALEFRLLRQHGFLVPQEVFSTFKDETGKFRACLSVDTMAMLSLYEASFLLVEGESILEEARNFATKSLEEFLKKKEKYLDPNDHDHVSLLVSHALELPLHWRMLRLETRWFIDFYERKQDMIPSLLELAKMDFNIVQSTHQEDLKEASRWWRNTGLGEKLDFARDRLMENFFWTVGFIFEPQYGYCRRMSTQVNALITVIDDIYDVYGTLDELELFTDAVERWDITALDRLPEYMRLCFFALHNSINEMAFVVLKEQGLHVVKYLQKADEIKRGDVPKSIQCYMHEAGVSEDEARRHIKCLISETWKQMNADRVADSPFSKTFIEIATNLARMAQCMYQHGDGHGIPDCETKDRVLSLLINPITH